MCLKIKMSHCDRAAHCMGAYFAARMNLVWDVPYCYRNLRCLTNIMLFNFFCMYMRDWLDVCTHRMDDVFFFVHILCIGMTIGFNK